MKNLITLAAITISLIISTSIKADELEILIGGWSYHSNNEYLYLKHDQPNHDQFIKEVKAGKKLKGVDFEIKKYNESHKMIGFKYNNIIASTFKNSYDNRSYLLGYNYNALEFNIIGLKQKANIMIGLVHGYKESEAGEAYIKNGFSLYVLPSLNTEFYSNDRFSFSVDTGILFASGQLVLTNSINIKIKF